MAEETLSSRKVFEGRALKLRVDSVKLPGGKETTREIVEHENCVAIIALDDADNILLVKQFRKPVEKELLEIPAGGIDPGETPEDASSPVANRRPARLSSTKTAWLSLPSTPPITSCW